MFDINIVNLNAGYYLCMATENTLAKSEREKKDLYLQAYLESRRTFNPMLYSADRIPGAEALSAQNILEKREREREREIESERERGRGRDIYIYIERDSEREKRIKT